MNPKDISVVILTSRGPRHSYFCRELERHFNLKGLVVDDRYHASDRILTFLKSCDYNPFRILKRLSLKKRILPFEKRDEKIERAAFPFEGGEFPVEVPLLLSPDPNGPEAVEWIKALKPDVIAVFGTRLIRDSVLSLAKYGVLNLHTGLSPFYRGGQCTFWCLYEKDPGHVGVTVHHLSGKIDGGDIVYTAVPDLTAEDTVRSIECKLVKLGTRDMIRAIRELAEGKAPRIPQKEKGKLFLSKMYTLEKRLHLETEFGQGLMKKMLNLP